jgi:hypothetical protein
MSVNHENLFNEILPNLFISGTLDDDVLENAMSYHELMHPAPFDSCVTLYGHARPFGYYVREQRFGIVDAELDPLSIPEIIQLSEWLYSEWKLGKRVAGKCQQGWNRSSLIVALVLMKDGMTANDAIALIREKRSKNALCNPHFVKFLKDYERGNLGRAS